MTYDIKQLTLGGILDQAVNLCKNHGKVLFGITCYLWIPFIIFQGLVGWALMPNVNANNIEAMQSSILLLSIASFILAIVQLVVVLPLTNGATIYAISNEYLGHPVSAGDAFKFALSRLAPLIWTGFLAGLLICLGLIALIIPGIYLAFRYFFNNQAVVIEGFSGGAALKRSGELMKGNFGTAFVIGIILFILGLLLGMIAGIIPVTLIQILLQAVIQAALFIFGSAVSVVFYFSARCKQENFDLTMLAKAVAEDGAGNQPAAKL